MVARLVQLSDVVRFFSRPIRALDGRVIRGIAQVPTRQPRVFDGTFIPRLLLKVAPDERLDQGTLLIDSDGNRYIAVSFSEDAYFNSRVKHTFVLMLINADVVWTRSASTMEPISGLRVPAPDVQLGTIPVVLEADKPEVDVLKVNAQSYKVLSNQPLQLGDRLNGMTIKQVTILNGVTNAHCY